MYSIALGQAMRSSFRPGIDFTKYDTYGIEPRIVIRSISDSLATILKADYNDSPKSCPRRRRLLAGVA